MASRTLTAPRHLRVVRERAAARSAASENRRTIALLLASTGMLTVIGLVMVLSASSVAAFARYGSSFLFVQRQAVYAVVGLGALLLTARLRYSVWQRLGYPFFAATVILLIVVLHPTAGTVAGGSARWIAIGPVTIQPSEIAKLSMITLTSAVLAKKWRRIDQPKHLLVPLVPALALVCVLVMFQPDLGTTVIIAGSVFMLLFSAGVRLRYLAMSASAGGVLVMVLILAEGYRRARFLSFLNPWGDPRNTGYQLIQSLIALGSGGWLGVGLGASRQKWSYVPNAHTDFIFSILGEELGLVGEVVVLLLFALLIYAGVRIAVRAPDIFGRLLAAGIVSWLGLQTLVNLGAVTGLLPVTGVPLPLLSFGGSSLVVTLAAVGILVSIGRSGARPRAPAAGRRR